MLSLFLAKRFYAGGRTSQEQTTQRRSDGRPLAIRIATAGVALGLAVMIVATSVVKGFQQEIMEKLTGFGGHLIVLNDSCFASPQSYPIRTDSATMALIGRTQGVAHVQRVSQKMGILKTDSAYQTICLKGVAAEYDLSFLRAHLEKGNFPTGKRTGGEEIVISRQQADALGLDVGSRVMAYFFENTIKMRRFRVTGIYKTNLPQFDNFFVLTDRTTVGKLNHWREDQSSQWEIRLTDPSRMDEVQIALHRELSARGGHDASPYTILSVKEHPHTAGAYAWLEVLDMNVWVILALMLGVAAFTMVSGLLILILERTRTIGILKAMGASNGRLRRTFILYAAMIVVRGLVWGNAVGLGLVLAQRHWGLVHLDPENYYVDSAPVLIDGWWMAGLNVGTLLITVLAMIVPSLLVSHIQPAKAIQFE